MIRMPIWSGNSLSYGCNLGINNEPVFFKNQQVEPRSQYRYDALYRLIEAKGRESAQAIAPTAGKLAKTQQQDFPINSFTTTDKTLRNYTQTYKYDSVGNIEQMKHVAVDGGWTRDYEYEEENNRLIKTVQGSNTIIYQYDTHGSMLNFNNVAEEYRPHWDSNDMIHHLNLGGGGDAYYDYGSDKERSRKQIINDTETIVEELLYLGGMERYRRWVNGDLKEEIETYHLFDGEQRVLMVEDVISTDNTADLKEGVLYRYQYGNHLGSVGLELDAVGRIISYEEYHPYGTTAFSARNKDIKASKKRYRYTGMERDEESGLSYHSARYYLPWLGRWGSVDPAGLVDGGNLYLFARSNPIILFDTTGTQSVGRMVNIEDTGAEASENLTLPVSSEHDPLVKLSGKGVSETEDVRLSQIKSAPNYIDNFVSVKGYGGSPIYPRHVGIQLTYQDGSTLDVPFTAISTSDRERTKEFQFHEGKWYPVSTDTGRGKAKLNLETTPVLASLYNYFNDQGREGAANNLFYAQLTVAFVIPLASGALGSTGMSGTPFQIPRIASTTARGVKSGTGKDAQVLGNVTDAEINAAFNNRELGSLVSARASKIPLTPAQIEKYGPQRGGQNSNIWFHDNLRVPKASPTGGVVFIRTHSANPGAPTGAFSRTNYTIQIHDKAGRYLLPNGSWKKINQMTTVERAAAHIPAGN